MKNKESEKWSKNYWRIFLNENIEIKKANNLIFRIEFMKEWDYTSKGGG